MDEGYTIQEWNAGVNAAVKLFRNIWQPRPKIKISEYAAKRRVLPSNTPFPGLWSNDRTPYLIEPMDNMSPMISVQHTVIVKGAQLGFTAAAENVVVYWMDVYPSEILFVSATEELLKKWATKRLEPAIDSCGVRHKIFAQTDNKNSRRTGDRIFSKEFVGGTLDMASAQAASALRSDSKRILVRDEIDGAPQLLKTGEGDWLKVSYVRTNAWGNRRKVLDFSTPTTYEESAIWPEYEDGDQRRFFIPCPFCGKEQTLEIGGTGTKGGLMWETTKGHLSEVYYKCDFCGDVFRNFHKGEFLKKGIWMPTRKINTPEKRTYQISSLYSPVGMLSWEELIKEYIAAENDPEAMRSFTNLYLGMPYRDEGTKPPIDKVYELRGNYKSGTVPNGVLFLTCAIDVQLGSEKDTKRPPRLEMEVCGHGIGYRTWSILYKIFTGSVFDIHGGAWEELTDFVMSGGLKFMRNDGLSFIPVISFIDARDGKISDVVFDYASRYDGIYPSMGSTEMKATKQGKKISDLLDMPKRGDNDKLRLHDREGVNYVVFASNWYKRILYRSLKIQRQEGDIQKARFCDFPSDYPDKWFEMLIAEEMRADQSFWKPSNRPNEALDLRVMNMAAGELWLALEVQRVRNRAMKINKMTREQANFIKSRHILDNYVKATARKTIKSA